MFAQVDMHRDVLTAHFYEYECYMPTYPHIPRVAKKHRKFKKEKELNKEVELKLDK